MPFRPHSLPMRLCNGHRLPFIWISSRGPITKLYCPSLIALTCALSVGVYWAFFSCYITWHRAALFGPPRLWQVSFASSLTSPRPLHPRDASNDIITGRVIRLYSEFTISALSNLHNFVYKSRGERPKAAAPPKIVDHSVGRLDHWSFYDLIVLRIFWHDKKAP